MGLCKKDVSNFSALAIRLRLTCINLSTWGLGHETMVSAVCLSIFLSLVQDVGFLVCDIFPVFVIVILDAIFVSYSAVVKMD